MTFQSTVYYLPKLTSLASVFRLILRRSHLRLLIPLIASSLLIICFYNNDNRQISCSCLFATTDLILINAVQSTITITNVAIHTSLHLLVTGYHKDNRGTDNNNNIFKREQQRCSRYKVKKSNINNCKFIRFRILWKQLISILLY